MNVTAFAKWTGTLLLLLTLGACGGGGDDHGGAGTPSAGTVVGAAGGTVTGPNGAKVVIPPGALTGNATINIAQIQGSSVVLPTGVTAFGPMFAFTPHGTTFAVPVTMTLPFDPASVPAGGTPQFFKTNAQNQWELIANAIFGAASVSAQVTSFSDVTNATGPLFRGDPVREWTFSDFRGRAMKVFEIFSDRREGGTLEDIRDFGGVFGLSPLFDHDIHSINGPVIPADGRANGQVFSSASGVTYGVMAEAPYGNPNLADSPAGSRVLLRQFQAFIKRSADATLSFTLTGAFLDLLDESGGFNPISSNPKCTYPPNVVDRLDACQDLVRAHLTFLVKAYTHATGPTTPGRTFFNSAGIAAARGHQGLFSTEFTPPMSAGTPLWAFGDFTVDLLPGLKGIIIDFNGPRTYTVDLSSIEVGQEFTLSSTVLAEATNRQGDKFNGGREGPSAASAFLRDPLSIGGSTIAFVGLDTINNPVLTPPADTLVEPAPCVPGPGPDPQSGVIQFSAAGYTIDEIGSAVQPVTITRSGGSRGAVTATFTTSNGTAIGGTDYTPVTATVFFGDGDTQTRLAEVPILLNSTDDQPPRTVNLALSQPGGCAALGAQSTAVLTIVEGGLPAPLPSFTVGGTVSGLVGTGLVLQDLHFLPITPGNGPFTFPLPTQSGSQYAVTIVTQPTNPLQICTITNGSGTVANANITNVLVNCVTPPPSGGLDPGFGGGKVSTAFGGDDTAMALQADGKIVMVGGSGTDFLLARYNVDGSLDTSFGSGGLVTSDVGSGSADEARAVAIQSDGKIVVAGNAVVGRTSNNQFNFDFAVARFNADGSPDTSFGNGGKVTTDFNGQTDRAFALAIQGDGKIVVAGSATPANGISTDFAVARYDSTGAPDNSFGSGGKLTTDVGGATDIAQNVVVQPNGAILVSGVLTLGSDPTLGHGGLARYDGNGIPDSSFGSGGKVTLPNVALGDALAVQGDAKIVVAGSAVVAGTFQFALMRLSASGSPDGGFGSNGLVTTGFSTQDDFGRAMAIQADDRIVVVGQSSNKSNPDFAVARYGTNGALDGSFGSGGKLTIDFFGSFDGAENVAVQSDGKIVVSGFARNGTRTGYGLVRILP